MAGRTSGATGARETQLRSKLVGQAPINSSMNRSGILGCKMRRRRTRCDWERNASEAGIQAGAPGGQEEEELPMAPAWMSVVPDVPFTGDDQGSTIYTALANLHVLGSFDESQFEAEVFAREATNGKGPLEPHPQADFARDGEPIALGKQQPPPEHFLIAFQPSHRISFESISAQCKNIALR